MKRRRSRAEQEDQGRPGKSGDPETPPVPPHQQPEMPPEAIRLFQRTVWQYYREHGRVFPWRQTRSPYHILVSEVMLQQTQTSRVLVKYREFITTFTGLHALAKAPLRNVLHAWQGLGYNRRALALHRTARIVEVCFHGQLPTSPAVLVGLPGIGRYTASAVAAFAYDQPTVFVETNIRTVYRHCFASHTGRGTDREILPLVEATLDRSNVREWYYALFDYGAMLKRSESIEARHVNHRKQSPFRGSDREIRGQILRLLVGSESVLVQELVKDIGQDAVRVERILRDLEAEGFISVTQGHTVRLQ